MVTFAVLHISIMNTEIPMKDYRRNLLLFIFEKIFIVASRFLKFDLCHDDMMYIYMYIYIYIYRQRETDRQRQR